MPPKKKKPEPPPRRRRAPPPPPAPPVDEASVGAEPPTPVPPVPEGNFTAATGAPVPTPPEVKATWVDWYNSAPGNVQATFDRAASVIDNGGSPYQKGGTYEAYVDNWHSAGPEFYGALVNYRDTGGRRALFAVPAKDYGKRPISNAQKGGPIERVSPTMLALHPGRYSYTDVTSKGPAFRMWLQLVRVAVTVGQTQVSPSALPGGDPYYIDYEFLVSQDTAWPDAVNGEKLNGTPTWVPKGINIIDYWGQVTSSHPDWDAPGRAIDKATDIGKGVLTFAAMLALGYVVYALKPNPTPHQKP